MLRGWAVVIVAAAAGAAAFFAVAVYQGHIALRGPSKLSKQQNLDVTYADFLAVTLTATTVVLGALALVIAVIAFRTLREIKEEAKRGAESEAKNSVSDEMQRLAPEIRKNVEAAALAGVEQALRRTLESAAATGLLAEWVERAQSARLRLDPTADQEMQEGYDPDDTGER